MKKINDEFLLLSGMYNYHGGKLVQRGPNPLSSHITTRSRSSRNIVYFVYIFFSISFFIFLSNGQKNNAGNPSVIHSQPLHFLTIVSQLVLLNQQPDMNSPIRYHTMLTLLLSDFRSPLSITHQQSQNVDLY